MAFLAPLLSIASAGLGIFTGIKSLIGGGKKDKGEPAPAPKPLPAQPKVEDAKQKAADQVARRRKISLLSGGDTNITRGQALLSEGDVGRKTLGG